MRNDYLGVYDSGVGGITVVKAIQEALPNENIVFLADSRNMPYGSKSREQIISYSLKNAAILSRYGLKAIVIACNTSDSIAKQELKDRYDLPIIGVINSAARKAALTSRNGKIAVLATEATTASRSYVESISSYNEEAEIYSIACPELVPLIEEGRFKGKDELMDAAIDRYLDIVTANNVDTIVLGCTHYDVLGDMIKEKLPEANIISSSRCVVEDLKEILKDNDIEAENKKPDYIYLATADSDNFRNVASELINDISIEIVE